jgi:hypothetical protein
VARARTAPDTMGGVTIDPEGPAPAGDASRDPAWREPVELDAPPPPGTPRERRRWFVPAVAAWAVVLLLAALYSATHDRPTVRDQTSVVQAAPTVAAAVADLVTAAGPRAVPAVSAFAGTGSCRITPMRAGTRYRQRVSFTTPVGGEGALLRTLAGGLPARYRARVSGDPGVLTADAGDYVGVRAERTVPGEVVADVTTGCRELGGDPAPDRATGAVDRTRVQFILDALGVRAQRWSTHEVPCPDGRGRVRTVEAVGVGSPSPGSLPETLKHTDWQADDVLVQPYRYAFRAGDAGFVATVRDGVVTVTMTTGCRH